MKDKIVIKECEFSPEPPAIHALGMWNGNPRIIPVYVLEFYEHNGRTVVRKWYIKEISKVRTDYFTKSNVVLADNYYNISMTAFSETIHETMESAHLSFYLFENTMDRGEIISVTGPLIPWFNTPFLMDDDIHNEI